MNKILNFFFGLFLIFQSCTNPNVFEITVPEGQNPYDSLFIQEFITGETIAKFPLNSPQRKFYFPIQQTLIANFQIKGTEWIYLSILEPGSKKELVFDGQNFGTKDQVADSLNNYIWHSTDEMFSRYGRLIFGGGDPEIVKEKFDSLIATRQESISKVSDRLTKGELAILTYHNQARANNFLMYYGRIIRKLAPKDSYFDFVEKFPAFGTEAKSLPDVILYQYEIEYLRKNDSIQSIPSFLELIESRTADPDLRNFLKAYYIQSAIEHPSYWRPHQHLFTTDQIKVALEREKDNPYSYLINRASNSFFSSLAGVAAYDFEANQVDDSPFKFSDLRGKLVLIDAWASWCGPCIQHRPKILEIASKYENDPRIAVVMVSVDSQLDKWKNYVAKTNPAGFGYEVNIPDGMNDTFGDKYLVKWIPKYFLIDPEGIIVSSDLPEPSLGMEQLIEKELEKMKKMP
ncbi:thiol-disulfide isomerase/thioredoxin [Algoriphagus boseongensis]|uniref:Thiol-disulfide isomerase/thioredoxin n=1 Tax=Algoriphagus boseongensis TaxID=1442587 RepID=A0A4R6T640_9BACT|nr:TlpA disulfide reductase family protein [Algoriphagus boseongensis]TDQ17132.1 thiol-disulfide isomerase/thioredoxin [Algoriphagus boseongensis]